MNNEDDDLVYFNKITPQNDNRFVDENGDDLVYLNKIFPEKDMNLVKENLGYCDNIACNIDESCANENKENDLVQHSKITPGKNTCFLIGNKEHDLVYLNKQLKRESLSGIEEQHVHGFDVNVCQKTRQRIEEAFHEEDLDVDSTSTGCLVYGNNSKVETYGNTDDNLNHFSLCSSCTQSEYMQVEPEKILDKCISRPLPSPESSVITRQESHGVSLAKHRLVRNTLAAVIVCLILVIAAVGVYLGLILRRLPEVQRGHQHKSERCSSACSKITCSSCCSTAAGAAVLSVSVDELSIEVPVTHDRSLVLMRREDGFVDFISPNWQKYKEGFGNVHREFWLGNEAMHRLTTNGSQWRLRVDMKAYSGECRYAEYNNFWIGPETDFYQMHISNYSGNAGDSLTATGKPWYNHDGVYFSTYDADHDHLNDTNCAKKWLGGWWYNSCFYAKFTGLYGHFIGLAWEDWLGEDIYLKYADMKITVV